MMTYFSHIGRLKDFVVNLGAAARSLPKIEEDIAHEHEVVSEIFVPGMKEKETGAKKTNIKEQIKELKESILNLEKLFNKIEKQAGSSEAGKKIKFKLDLLHHRLMVLEKKKSK